MTRCECGSAGVLTDGICGECGGRFTASPPPAATATCPHGWPPMSPTQTAPCLLCEVAALRAEVEAWRQQAKEARDAALEAIRQIRAAEAARVLARQAEIAAKTEKNEARAALAALRGRIEALAKEWDALTADLKGTNVTGEIMIAIVRARADELRRALASSERGAP